jgi:hypothetical protein
MISFETQIMNLFILCTCFVLEDFPEIIPKKDVCTEQWNDQLGEAFPMGKHIYMFAHEHEHEHGVE